MKAVLKILGVILIGIGVIILIAGKSAASDALGLIILLLMGGIPAALGVLCLLKSKKTLLCVLCTGAVTEPGTFDSL